MTNFILKHRFNNPLSCFREVHFLTFDGDLLNLCKSLDYNSNCSVLFNITYNIIIYNITQF